MPLNISGAEFVESASLDEELLLPPAVSGDCCAAGATTISARLESARLESELVDGGGVDGRSPDSKLTSSVTG